MTTDTKPYRTVGGIIERNAETGHHFFDPDTLRFFRSRVSDKLYGGRFFVTSERTWDDGRAWTVRYATDAGQILDCGGFGAFTSSAGAHRYAAKLATRGATLCGRCREVVDPESGHHLGGYGVSFDEPSTGLPIYLDQDAQCARMAEDGWSWSPDGNAVWEADA